MISNHVPVRSSVAHGVNATHAAVQMRCPHAVMVADFIVDQEPHSVSLTLSIGTRHLCPPCIRRRHMRRKSSYECKLACINEAMRSHSAYVCKPSPKQDNVRRSQKAASQIRTQMQTLPMYCDFNPHPLSSTSSAIAVPPRLDYHLIPTA
jgi:hypothetical protein